MVRQKCKIFTIDDYFSHRFLQFAVGKKNDQSGIVHTHTRMGLSYEFSIPLVKQRASGVGEYEFLKWFADKVYRQNKILHISQKPTSITSFYVDYDFKFYVKPGDLSYVTNVCCFVAKRVAEFFPLLLGKDVENVDYDASTCPPFDTERVCWMGSGEGSNRLRSIVCFTDCTYVDNNKKSYWKVGAHQYWIGRLGLNELQCKTMIEYIIECLINSAFDKKNHNNWEDIVDSSVYGEGKSLRMVGSRKIDDCKCKKSNTSHSCAICKGTKRVSVNRTYEPRFVLNHKGDFDVSSEWILHDPLQFVLATSIRTNMTPDDVDVNWICPKVSVEMNKSENFTDFLLFSLQRKSTINCCSIML